MGTNEVLAIALKALKKGGGGGGGTSNYNSLTNLPKINGITLQGNKSSDDLGIFDASVLLTLEFDSTQAYPVGDIVVYEDGLYRFTTAHAANDPWDATEVEAVTVSQLIAEKPSAIHISQDDYNALSQAEKNDPTKVYYVYDAPSGGGGTTDYLELDNKPSINGTTLTGNKSFDDLGLNTYMDDQDLTEAQMTNLLNLI